MTTAEKITEVQVLVENDEHATDSVCMVYLRRAENAILSRLYRVRGSIPDGAVMPEMYEHLQCEKAAREFLRRGAQGELVHNENGTNRTYGSVDDEDIMCQVMPYAAVPARGEEDE